MAARPSLTSAFRRGTALVSQQCAKLSSTARASSLKFDLGTPTRRSPPPVRRTGGPRDRDKQQGGDSNNRSSTDRLHMLYKDSRAGQSQGRQHSERARHETLRTMDDATTSQNYLRQMPRRWKKGDVYAPRDLSPFEMTKWRGQTAVKKDVLDILGLNPLDNYRNFTMISEFMTSFGRIKHSEETGLRPVNQRKMAKAIRRAIGLGIHPSVHYHPEILLKVSQNIAQQSHAREGSKPRSTTPF